MLLRGFHALASYVLRDGGAKDLQRAEYHFSAAMQLADGFGIKDRWVLSARKREFNSIFFLIFP